VLYSTRGLSLSGCCKENGDPPASIRIGHFSLLIADSFDPPRTYPEFPNDSAENPKEEKQTQGREKHTEDKDEP
jgi:hypothetical protein